MIDINNEISIYSGIAKKLTEIALDLQKLSNQNRIDNEETLYLRSIYINLIDMANRKYSELYNIIKKG